MKPESSNDTSPQEAGTMPDYPHILNETAFKLVDLPDEESIYAYLGETLYHLLDQQAVVLINRSTPDETGFRMQGIYGVNAAQLTRAADLLGYSPMEAEFKSRPELIPLFRRGELIHVEGGLVEIARGIVSPAIVRQLVRLLNLGEVYLIGLTKGAQFYAAVQIYMRGHSTIGYPELIEAIVQQASTAIQRIQALESLAETKIHYESLFQQSNDAVFILDLQGHHIRANQRAADMMGYTSDEIIGLSYREMVIEGEHAKSEAILENMMRGERVPPYERTFCHKDGNPIPVEINVELVCDEHGNPLYIQSIARDITERKQAQQRDLELRLEQERRQLITTFIENATHEFSTPLSVINVQSELMARTEDADNRMQRASEISNQVKRLNRLVKSLVLITKLQSKSTLAIDPVDVGHILQQVCRSVRGDCARNHTLHCDVPPGMPPVKGDVAYLRDALIQIMDNACRSIVDGGTIHITTQVVDTQVWIDISNNGPAIPAEALPHIFETFWRQDNSPNPPGFGLGLPIARKIIELHGGEIEVGSSDEQGTTMRVRLPLLAEQK